MSIHEKKYLLPNSNYKYGIVKEVLLGSKQGTIGMEELIFLCVSWYKLALFASRLVRQAYGNKVDSVVSQKLTLDLYISCNVFSTAINC